MAQKIITTLVDDIDGSDAVETVTFALDGATYALDLSAANADRLRAALGSWVVKARKTGGKATRSRTNLRPAGESRSAIIRVWASENGHPAPARGRLPRATVEAYDAAH